MKVSDPGKEQWRLRRMGLAYAAGTLALVGLLLASPAGKRASMPGPLSANHAHLREDCSKCHVSSPTAIQSLWHGVAITRVDREQSELCLSCHDLGVHPLQPHGWSDVEWEAALDGGTAERTHAEGLACSTCHHEHRGQLGALARLADNRCQACHETTFESFEDGHPEFESFPYTRRTNLVFDHTLHILREFRGEHADDAPLSCTDCHRLDASGRRMPTLAYAAACAACHDEEVKGSTQFEGAGLTVLALPAIDLLTLEDEGIGIGSWPADSALSESPLTPFLALLLSADEGARADLAVLEGLDLLDLQEADASELEALARTVWGIKGVLLEIARGGHVALIERIERATNGVRALESPEDLLAGLPEDLVTRALAAWIPDLAGELERHRAGEEVPTDSNLDEAQADLDGDEKHEAWVNSGGWYLQEMNFALRYRPLGHADPLLRSWLDLSARGGEATRALFAELGDPAAIGMCTKCHSVEERDASSGRTGLGPVVHWRGTQQGTHTSALTRFSHVEHFAAYSENTCLTCHELNRENEGWGETYAGRDAAAFIPGFLSMSVATCTECHSESGVPASCTTCHAYHAHPDTRNLPDALLQALSPALSPAR